MSIKPINPEGCSTDCLISMVVDALPEHYYKAELLIFSLLHFGNVSRRQVVVQCVDGVCPEFKRFAADQGCQVREVRPYLDKKYCNKLQQLHEFNGFSSGDFSGILLLDVDIAIVDQLTLPRLDRVLGKIVDAPNPPLTVLEGIFSAANVVKPAIVQCDWQTGQTLAGNFNGGFLYVPKDFVVDVSKRWRYWAEWLFGRPELFETLSQSIHIDQIAMALSLAEGTAPFESLPANYNFPGHADQLPSSFSPSETLRAVHYHWEVSEFGFINRKLDDFMPLRQALDDLNLALAAFTNFTFYGPFRKAMVAKDSLPLVDNGPLRSRFSSQTKTHPMGRLILHAGTPKTGTSSLQWFCDQNRQLLEEQGIYYPVADGNTAAPKHQWLVNYLLAVNVSDFVERMARICDELGHKQGIHTLILSTEGLFNHWWDFGIEGKAMLAELTLLFNVEFWLWLRRPDSFASSFYRQNLLNPQVMPSYGRDLSFTECLADDWFSRHLDYLGVIYDAQRIFGDHSVRAFSYTGDTVAAFIEALDVKGLSGQSRAENIGIGQIGVDMARVVNRYSLPFQTKAEVAKKIKEIDAMIGEVVDQPFCLSKDERLLIERLTRLQAAVLQREFGVDWKRHDD